MSEPFELETPGTPEPQRKQELGLSADNLWDKIRSLWHTIWAKSLYIRHRGETQVKLPLPLAIVLGVCFPHVAVPILVIGILAGFSFTIGAR
jgi:hypothetical protein